MARVYFYMGFAIIVMLILALTGMQTNTGKVLGKLGLVKPADVQNLEKNSFYVNLIGYIGLLAGVAGIIIGAFTRGSSTTSVAAGAGGILLWFVSDLLSIVNISNATNTGSGVEYTIGWIVFIVMIPLVLAYILSIFDWVRNGE